MLPARALEEFQSLLELTDDEVEARLRSLEASEPEVAAAVRLAYTLLEMASTAQITIKPPQK